MQAATAQNCAAALLVAAQQNVPCASWTIVRRSEDVYAPTILVPNAGHTDTYYHVNAQRSAATQWRSASQNGTRPVVAIDKVGRLRSLKSIVGITTGKEVDLAWQIWQVFGIPLATVWYLETEEGPLFVSLDPLPLHDLTERELRLFEEVSTRPMSPS